MENNAFYHCMAIENRKKYHKYMFWIAIKTILN